MGQMERIDEEGIILLIYRVCHEFRLTKRVAFFELILTTFKLSTVFRGSWGSIENWLEPKIEPLLGNLACPNR
jgi:hypothetical protein